MMDEDIAEAYAFELDILLNRMGEDDFFGTERQLDPRGDFRDNEWSVQENVEGVEK